MWLQNTHRAAECCANARECGAPSAVPLIRTVSVLAGAGAGWESQ